MTGGEFRVLDPGFPKNTEIWIGILPQGKELRVHCPRFVSVAAHSISSCQTEVSQRPIKRAWHLPIKRLSGLPLSSAALLVALLGLLGILGIVLNGWHSDRTGERRSHASIPLLCAGVAYLLIPSSSNFSISLALLVLGGGVFYSYYPVFWSIPTMFLSETAAAASFGMINSVGLIGGFIGPYAVGWLNDRTGSLSAAFLLIAVCYLMAGTALALIKIPSPSMAANFPAEQDLAAS